MLKGAVKDSEESYHEHDSAHHPRVIQLLQVLDGYDDDPGDGYVGGGLKQPLVALFQED